MGDDEVDGFGEEYIPAVASATGENAWTVKSQEAFELDTGKGTLTILENQALDLVRFEVLDLQTADTTYITCSNAEFNGICQEQIVKGLEGPAQVSAAIRQIFDEASQAESREEEQPVIRMKSVSKTLKSSGGPTAATSEAVDEWCVLSQEAMQIASKNCTVTIMQNPARMLLRFEVLVFETAETYHTSMTSDQFDVVCQEQVGLTGPAQTRAAIEDVFRDSIEGKPASAGSSRFSASVGKMAIGEDGAEADERMRMRRRSVTSAFGDDS